MFFSLLMCGPLFHRSHYIGLGNGLQPDSIKPLPEAVLTAYNWGLFWQSPEGNLIRNSYHTQKCV